MGMMTFFTNRTQKNIDVYSKVTSCSCWLSVSTPEYIESLDTSSKFCPFLFLSVWIPENWSLRRNFFLHSTDFFPCLSFPGVGLILLSVCNIYQPALSSAGVLLPLQEEEDAGKVSSGCLQMHSPMLLSSFHAAPCSLTPCLPAAHTHLTMIFHHAGMGTWGWWWAVRSSACGRI